MPIKKDYLLIFANIKKIGKDNYATEEKKRGYDENKN